MCIAISIPSRYRQLQSRVEVSAVIETLLYDSDSRQVIISFDCIVRNESSGPVDLWLTHGDDVEARLGTEDWYSLRTARPDRRAWLVSSVFDGCWDFDAETSLLGFRDPVETYPDESFACSPSRVAQALTFRNDQRRDDGAIEAYRDFFDLSAEPYSEPGRDTCAPAYRLRAYPDVGQVEPRNQAARPFSTFRIGPIGPSKDGHETVFRLTIVVAGNSYTRLVQPHEGAPFYVYSSDRIINEIEDFSLRRFQRHRLHSTFRQFFDSEVKNSIIHPEKYQIIVGQPDEGRTRAKPVVVHPTSSRISERVISPSDARQRALWFNAWSSDFSMVLEYGDDAEIGSTSRRTLRRPASLG